MNRRQFSLSLVPLSCLVAGHVLAQGAPKKEESARPFRAVNVPEDGRRVLFFFDFACPFCAGYHDPLLNFAATVPKGIQTMFIPVVNVADVVRKQEQIIAAKCYYAALAIASSRHETQYTRLFRS